MPEIDNDNLFFQNYLVNLRQLKSKRFDLISNLFILDIANIVNSYLPKDAIFSKNDVYSILIHDGNNRVIHELVIKDDKDKQVHFVRKSQNNDKWIFRKKYNGEYNGGIEFCYYYSFSDETMTWSRDSFVDGEETRALNLYTYKTTRIFREKNPGTMCSSIEEWTNESLGVFILDYNFYRLDNTDNQIVCVHCMHCGNKIASFKYENNCCCSFAVDMSPFNQNQNYYSLYNIENENFLEIRDLYTNELKFKFVCPYKFLREEEKLDGIDEVATSQIIYKKVQYYLFVFGSQIYFKFNYGEAYTSFKINLNYQDMTFSTEDILEKYIMIYSM